MKKSNKIKNFNQVSTGTVRTGAVNFDYNKVSTGSVNIDVN
jgi:hypothetical protein